MLKFELLNIFLFQHPKDGLGEELNTNQICVIRGDQFFDKPEDGTEEYFVSEPNEFDYWDYWKLLSLSVNSRLSLFMQQQKEAIARVEKQQKEIVGRIDGFEQRLLACILFICYTHQENGRRLDEFEQRINRRIDDVERRIDGVERQIDGVEQRINRRIDDVEQRINRVEELVNGAADLITLQDQDITNQQQDIENLRALIGVLGHRLLGLMDHLHLGNKPVVEGGQEPDDEEQLGNGLIE
uniref:t-SNARE coiled-coil homology domain-containing protein n=1 Tax=Meloidogyne javanica TaxID=6303 RepID=A0A915NDM9_MELJA